MVLNGEPDQIEMASQMKDKEGEKQEDLTW
jgi:hypothetical protein